MMTGANAAESGSGFCPLDDARAFRTALGRFATGVTVVTAPSPDGPIGITANSFASVSIDPALVLWSPAKASTRHDAFVEAVRFNIHVLSAEQAHVSTAFVRRKHGFDGLDWETTEVGTPWLRNCLAVFQCRRVATHDGGDHTIVIGEVDTVHERPGSPLIFANGEFVDGPVADGRRATG
jgi:flavin reductase (DIM6/NTAB) family NADH-FMN oxidoreductase RutF